MTAAKDPRAPFERVSDDLRARIAAGEFVIGDRLPSGRELAESHGVALATAQSALKRLRNEGIATSSPRGYVVADPASAEADGDLRRELDETRAELRALARRVQRLEQDADR